MSLCFKYFCFSRAVNADVRLHRYRCNVLSLQHTSKLCCCQRDRNTRRGIWGACILLETLQLGRISELLCSCRSGHTYGGYTIFISVHIPSICETCRGYAEKLCESHSTPLPAGLKHFTHFTPPTSSPTPPTSLHPLHHPLYHPLHPLHHTLHPLHSCPLIQNSNHFTPFSSLMPLERTPSPRTAGVRKLEGSWGPINRSRRMKRKPKWRLRMTAPVSTKANHVH